MARTVALALVSGTNPLVVTQRIEPASFAALGCAMLSGVR